MPEIMGLIDDVNVTELAELESSQFALLSSVRGVVEIAINDTMIAGTPAFFQHCDARIQAKRTVNENPSLY